MTHKVGYRWRPRAPLLGGTDYHECGLAPEAEPHSQFSTLNELVQLMRTFLREIRVQEQPEIPMEPLCPLNKHGQPISEPQPLKLDGEGLHLLNVHQPR